MDTHAISGRYKEVLEAIEEACAEAGRAPGDVCLVAVSKRHPPEAIRAAYALGMRDFGENYAQELAEKRSALAPELPEARWHFIGRVQSNKAKELVSADCVHGVGKLGHAEALSRRAVEGAPLRFLTQVNVSGEAQKNGFSFSDLRENAQALSALPGVRWAGLMAMLMEGERGEAARAAYGRVRALRDELEQLIGRSLPELSMGMSGDFREAIAEGATMIRVGTAIFGPRAPAGGVG
jgi:pyridoxal phosphate enzyme (YggS family)